jgi:hypothetical protein
MRLPLANCAHAKAGARQTAKSLAKVPLAG